MDLIGKALEKLRVRMILHPAWARLINKVMRLTADPKYLEYSWWYCRAHAPLQINKCRAPSIPLSMASSPSYIMEMEVIRSNVGATLI